ncbi:hypothetical protein CF327_g2578 [Tilletia walkeri]|uniref:N-terminal acetyltransferase A complex subunit nat1 n=1 Tax=Tilletia walkeri TaxID=117179 RepID=A0A8X7NCP3_9BASI|nr:hypothetical protein CF327_g2578 [Tilletia walkeri]KAE8271501.1 hypothetical protein A4X09_0g835 [Tilletia walkeri]
MPPKKSAALPTKERVLFANLLQDYEKRKYRLGVKTADSILKKFPEHGETLAMKGLLLASLHRKQEGLELAKKGLRFDLSSFICWHALGIIYRMERNYQEAIKSYTRALHIEGGNINLLRELAFMHMQERNFAPLIDNRLTLLRVQPHFRTTWIALAVAHHAAGSVDEAIRVIEAFESTFRDVPKRYYEQSEIRLYLASLYEEAGRAKDVITYLARFNDDDIVDYAPRDEIFARAYQKLGNSTEAAKLWQKLFKRNPEEKTYVQGLLQARDVKQGTTSATDIVTAFKSIGNTVSRSNVVRRQLLSFLPAGDEFKSEADDYLLTGLQRGIPSLFNDLKSLYVDSAKRDTIYSIAESYRSQWVAYKEPTSSAEAAAQESPSSLLWVLYFLAQHYSAVQEGQKALDTIDAAISHSPTMPELHLTRARILKRMGDLQGAAHTMETGRLLDGQDRYMNSKGALYMLRIGNIEEAVRVMGLFTRPTVETPVADLLEMQALWYLVEEGLAWERKGVLNMALKRLDQVDKIFQEHYEDQMDFHTYCLRKVTLRGYMQTIRWENQLRSHPQYVRAALAAIDLYVRLHDDPSLRKASKSGEGSGTGGKEMTDEERKAAKKAKKAEAKAAEDAAAAAAAATAAAAKSKKGNGNAAAAAAAAEEEEPAVLKDEDPEGVTLISNEKPLDEAEKYVKVLQTRAEQRVETWLATFEVAIRRKAWLAAARALQYAKAIDATNAEVHYLFVRFQNSLPKLEDLPEHVRPAIKSTVEAFNPSNIDLEQYAKSLTQTYPNSAPHVLASAQALAEVRGSEGKEEVFELTLQATRPEYKASLTTLQAAQKLLTSTAQSSERVAEFNTAAAKQWPHANAFQTAAQKEAAAQARAEERADWDAMPDVQDGAPAP